jgi:hypothetical protein
MSYSSVRGMSGLYTVSNVTDSYPSGLFRGMFSIPNTGYVNDIMNNSASPISILITLQEITSLYGAMCAGLFPRKRKRSGPAIRESLVYLNDMSLEATGSLSRLADRFDCERIQQALAVNFKRLALHRPARFLGRCSDVNAVPPARVAIAALPNFYTEDWPFGRGTLGGDMSDWWKAISPFRPSWQLELSRLFWEGGQQLVDRPEEDRLRKGNRRAYSRHREQALHQTRKSWAQIAEEFNPPAW